MDITQLLQAIILGIVQGVTEWLPISSKAMVSLVMIKFFNADVTLSEAVYYAIWLHLGNHTARWAMPIVKISPY